MDWLEGILGYIIPMYAVDSLTALLEVIYLGKWY